MRKHKTLKELTAVSYSPAPWKVTNVDPHKDPGGKLVVFCDWDGPRSGYDIAVLPLNLRGLGYRQANANLIVAAPELLGALNECIERLEVLCDAEEATRVDVRVLTHAKRVAQKALGNATE